MDPRPTEIPLRAPVLVVGTGRCGSTALSAAVALHPSWLSLSELFSAFLPAPFPPGELTGPAFEALISEPRLDMRLALAHRLEPPEFLYPVDGGGRYTRGTGVPPLSMVTLPHLVGVGDDLLEELQAAVRAWPPAPAAAHFRRLLDGLARRFGKSRWVERSGGSLAFLGALLDAFPDAKVVHLWRDGLACSVSMARHASFRLALVRREMVRRHGVDPYASPERPPDLLAGELAACLPERFDPEAFRALDLPLAKFAGLWASQLLMGLDRLAALPAERLLHLRFEELLGDPRGTLARFARFVDGEVPESWLTEAAALVRTERPESPVPDPAARVRHIVAEGHRQLRRAGVPGA
ncbi:MAG: sulfotransferase [Holophagaceae bacterium]